MFKSTNKRSLISVLLRPQVRGDEAREAARGGPGERDDPDAEDGDGERAHGGRRAHSGLRRSERRTIAYFPEAQSRLPDSHNADGLITITWSTSTFEYYETASMFHSKPCLCPFAECKRFIECNVPDAFDLVHEEKCSTAADKLLAGGHENGATAELRCFRTHSTLEN